MQSFLKWCCSDEWKYSFQLGQRWGWLPFGGAFSVLAPVYLVITWPGQDSLRIFLQIEALSSHFHHGMLNIFLLCHVYAVFKLNINGLVNTVWAPENLGCVFLISAPPEKFFMSNEVNERQRDGMFPLTKACFYSGILSFIRIFYTYLSLELFLNTCHLKITLPECQLLLIRTMKWNKTELVENSLLFKHLDLEFRLVFISKILE